MKLSEVLVKSFLMGVLITGLERAGIVGVSLVPPKDLQCSLEHKHLPLDKCLNITEALLGLSVRSLFIYSLLSARCSAR